MLLLLSRRSRKRCSKRMLAPFSSRVPQCSNALAIPTICFPGGQLTLARPCCNQRTEFPSPQQITPLPQTAEVCPLASKPRGKPKRRSQQRR